MKTSRKKLLEESRKRAFQYEMEYSGCCQSVLAALQKTLDLEDRGALRAASGLAGGIARRGETCGALIAAIMAVCQVVGREKMEDVEQYRAAMEPCGEIYEKFEKEVGHTNCGEIHKILYGKSFRLHKQEEFEAFLAVGGHGPKGCPVVCGKAAEIAAGMILDLRKKKH
ncbi:MAG: hypothetical protein GTN81_16360 [Proteobacteria bacterium]|nr:hypothetical protein [Pseudomonadota bacterium]